MTRIYIVRHAEAEGNLFRRIHGQYESSITCNGMRQIEALRERFAPEQIDACYSSDLIRTRTTAQAVWVPKHLTLHLEPRFREVRLGRWEDVPFGQLEREEPVMMGRFSGDPFHWEVEGAERFEEYSGRFLEALREVAQRHDGQTVAIFSHGCVIRAMQMCLFYTPDTISEIGHCDNTGVSLLEYENGTFRAVYLNDNSHLSPEISTLARQNWWRETSGRKDRNLWFRPLRDDGSWYAACRKNAWENVYGPAEAFDGVAYYRDALQEAAGEPWAICEAMLGEERVGLLQLAVHRDADRGVGYIPFLYLRPEFRGQGLGIQLIGQAVSFYRMRNRDRLQLRVSPENQGALTFYRRYGFRELPEPPEGAHRLIRMELNLDLQQNLASERQISTV